MNEFPETIEQQIEINGRLLKENTKLTERVQQLAEESNHFRNIALANKITMMNLLVQQHMDPALVNGLIMEYVGFSTTQLEAEGNQIVFEYRERRAELRRAFPLRSDGNEEGTTT